MSKHGIACCGRNHITPFCSLCGKRLIENHVLGDLLRHCELSLGGLKDKYQSRVSRGHPSERKEHTIARWQRWVDELGKLIRGE